MARSFDPVPMPHGRRHFVGGFSSDLCAALGLLLPLLCAVPCHSHEIEDSARLERALWETRTVLKTAQELIEGGDQELARLVLQIGSDRLDQAGARGMIECQGAPGATGKLLVAARKDLLLAFALNGTTRRARVSQLLRAARRPLRGYARYGAPPQREAAALLERTIASALEQSGQDREPVRTEEILDWWATIEAWCHATQDARSSNTPLADQRRSPANLPSSGVQGADLFEPLEDDAR